MKELRSPSVNHFPPHSGPLSRGEGEQGNGLLIRRERVGKLDYIYTGMTIFKGFI